MRSYLVFDKDLPHFEKMMEMDWHLREKRHHEAKKIKDDLLDKWHGQPIGDKENNMGVKWVQRANADSLEVIDGKRI